MIWKFTATGSLPIFDGLVMIQPPFLCFMAGRKPGCAGLAPATGAGAGACLPPQLRELAAAIAAPDLAPRLRKPRFARLAPPPFRGKTLFSGVINQRRFTRSLLMRVDGLLF